jgi:phosphatidylglycerophosphate synthase
LDQVADKLMVAAALICLVGAYAQYPHRDITLPTAISIMREVGVSALREWMAQGGQRDTVQVGFAGKCKTAAQMIGITLLLLALPPSASATCDALFLPVRPVHHGHLLERGEYSSSAHPPSGACHVLVLNLLIYLLRFALPSCCLACTYRKVPCF